MKDLVDKLAKGEVGVLGVVSELVAEVEKLKSEVDKLKKEIEGLKKADAKTNTKKVFKKTAKE
jgi:outer membrane murein-binding lipoprotein Lpp